MKIRAVTSDDFPQWLALWNANNLGQVNEAVTTQTWMRILDADAPVHALVTEDKGNLVGLVQYVVHPTTGSINDVCYMQDVFVAPERRKQGIARKMVTALGRIGSREKWARIYWLAESDNEAAQALYRDLGQKLDFTLHVLAMG